MVEKIIAYSSIVPWILLIGGIIKYIYNRHKIRTNKNNVFTKFKIDLNNNIDIDNICQAFSILDKYFSSVVTTKNNSAMISDLSEAVNKKTLEIVKDSHNIQTNTRIYNEIIKKFCALETDYSTQIITTNNIVTKIKLIKKELEQLFDYVENPYKKSIWENCQAVKMGVTPVNVQQNNVVSITKQQNISIMFNKFKNSHPYEYIDKKVVFKEIEGKKKILLKLLK